MYFNTIWIKIFIDDLIEKVVCVVAYDYIFEFITHFRFILSI